MAFGFIGVSLAALFLGNTITVVGVRLGFVDRHTTAREKVELNFNAMNADSKLMLYSNLSP